MTADTCVNKIELSTGAWFYDAGTELSVPANWNVEMVRPGKTPEMTEDEVRSISSRYFSEALSPGEKTVLLIDDLTRPTPASTVLEEMLAVMKDKDISSEEIKIVVSTGTHEMSPELCLMKTGRKVADELEIEVHDCERDLDEIGITVSGVPVLVNRTVAEADTVISIGCVLPHDDAGFGGGSKMCIGVLGLETISLLHRKFCGAGRRGDSSSSFRKEIEMIGLMIGLEKSLIAVIGSKREITGLFTGSPEKTFNDAVKMARQIFGVESEGKADVVIANSYPMDTSGAVMGKSLWPFNKHCEGTVKILIGAPVPELGRRRLLCSSPAEKLAQKIKKMTLLSFFKRAVVLMAFRTRGLFCPGHKWKNVVMFIPKKTGEKSCVPVMWPGVYVFRSWKDLVDDWSKNFSSAGEIKVRVYPCAPLQFYSEKEDESREGVRGR